MVIDHHNLDVLVALVQARLDGAADKLLGVLERYEHRNEGTAD